MQVIKFVFYVFFGAMPYLLSEDFKMATFLALAFGNLIAVLTVLTFLIGI